MKVALGMYTTLSNSTPAPAFKRALSLIYQPLLRLLYNSEGLKFNLYQSSGVMKYFENNNPEINMLLSALSKRGDLEILSGSYSQSIIGLNMPKDRGRQIEKMTTFIRRTYGCKARTAFFYGQIWSPQFISTLSNCALTSVAISSYKATSKKVLFSHCSIMNELGRRIKIIPISDALSSLVSKYAQKEIGLAELKRGTGEILESLNDEDEVFFFINLDQLLQGMALSAEDDEDAVSIFPFIIDLVKKRDGKFINVSDFSPSGPCYLDSGWYGRDASTLGLQSFNEIFIKDGTNRYLLNRLFYVSEALSSFKKEKDVRRLCEDHIANAGAGTLFLFDPQCGPLRTSERKIFWHALLNVEKLLYGANELLLNQEAELEDYGQGNFFSRNQNFTVVYSPFGGSVLEFDLMDKLINVFDAKSPFEKNPGENSIRHSLSETIMMNGEVYKSKHYKMEAQALNKTRSDYLFSLNDEALPFALDKHYKLRNQTFSLESTLTLNQDVPDGVYSLNCFLMVPDQLALTQEQNRAMLLGSLDNIRTMRIFAGSDVQLAFTSTSPFSVKQDVRTQSQFTVLGKESFNLYNKFTFSFPFSAKKGESCTFKLILRSADIRNKE